MFKNAQAAATNKNDARERLARIYEAWGKADKAAEYGALLRKEEAGEEN